MLKGNTYIDVFGEIDDYLANNSEQRRIDSKIDNTSDCSSLKKLSLIPFIDEPDINAIVNKTVDNPGNGNCAFYAFAIGLIHIIKYEFDCKKQDIFNRWSMLDANIKQYELKITKFDFDNPWHNPNLLEILQSSLRQILYQSQLETLQDACINPGENNKNLTANINFSMFSECYYQGNNIRYNDCNKFFGCEDTQESLKKEFAVIRKVTPNAPSDETPKLIKLFLKLLYGDNKPITQETPFLSGSLITKAIGNVGRNFIWGTSDDLITLAQLFDVNLNTLRSGIQQSYQFSNTPNKHTIVVNNHYNVHWTTKITVAQTVTDEKPSLFSFFPVFPRKNQNTLPGAFNGNIIKNSKSDAVSFNIKDTDDKFLKLKQLNQNVKQANIAYQTYSNSLWFSLFHRHGASGRARANKFTQTFSKLIDNLIKNNDTAAYDTAKEELYKFLNNRNDNGNTNPHSFKTMCLKELTDVSFCPSLKAMSDDYELYLGLLNSKAP